MSQGWAGEHARGMRNPLGWFPGFGAGRGGVCGGGGGCARRSIAGVRSRGCWGVLQARIASVNVRRGLGGAHRGSKRAWGVVQGVRRRRPAARSLRARGGGEAEGPRASQASRIDARGSCGDVTGVSAACGSPAARNRAGGASYRRWPSGRKSTARGLFSGLGQRRRRGWDAQGCGVRLKKRSPLISACPLGWRSAGIAASGCSTGKVDLIAISAGFRLGWSF